VRRAAPCVIGLAVLLAAGCGSGSKTYSLAKTRACLQKRGVTIAAVLPSDFVATTATGGSLRAIVPGNFVTIAMGDNEEDGAQLEKAYHRFAFANVRMGLADVLKRDGNAVMLWHLHPEQDQQSLVENCLK
jgi:hypothetical protein